MQSVLLRSLRFLSHPSQNILPAHYYSSTSMDHSYIFIFGAPAQKENEKERTGQKSQPGTATLALLCRFAMWLLLAHVFEPFKRCCFEFKVERWQTFLGLIEKETFEAVNEDVKTTVWQRVCSCQEWQTFQFISEKSTFNIISWEAFYIYRHG